MTQVPIQPGLFTLPGDPRGIRLLASRCPGCGRHHFPAAETCPYCRGDGCEAAAVGARGRIYLATVVTAAPPGYRGPVPYGFGVVELEEGLRVVTRLADARIESLAPGTPVELQVAPLFRNEDGDEVLSFSYAPAGARPEVAPGAADAGAAGGQRGERE